MITTHAQRPAGVSGAAVSPPVPESPRPSPARPTDPTPFYQLLIESLKDYAIFAMDLQRRVTMWSAGAERVFGYSEAEMTGQSADIIFTPEDRAKGAPVEEATTALSKGRAADERSLQRRGNVVHSTKKLDLNRVRELVIAG